MSVEKRQNGRDQTITITQKGTQWELKREAFGFWGLNPWFNVDAEITVPSNNDLWGLLVDRVEGGLPVAP